MPSFDVNTFRASVLARGLMRPAYFRVRMFPPTGLALTDEVNAMLQELEVWGEAASLPALQMGAHQMYRHGYGAVEKRPFMPVYEGAWIVSFRLDADGNIWRFFKEWNNLIVNNSGDSFNEGGVSLYELAYKDDYLADVEIAVFDELGNQTVSATLIEAFPYSLGDVKLDWQETKEYARCMVGMSFTDWRETAIAN